MKHTVTRTAAVLLAALLALLATTTGCGGASGGTSGTGISGGTSGTGISGGPLTSFGSVIINGTVYRTSADDPTIATVFVGPFAGFGEPNLAPGMLVQVEWDTNATNTPRRARRITYLPELTGTVTRALVPGVAGVPAQLAVAARTVVLLPTTLFADSYARDNPGTTVLTGVQQLAPGLDQVEVSGYLTVTDPVTGASRLEATRIARIGRNVATDAATVATGIVSAAASDGSFLLRDSAGATLTVRADVGIVTDQTLLTTTRDRLRDGSPVRVEGILDGTTLNSVTAIGRALQSLQPVSSSSTTRVDGEYDGYVTSPPDGAGEFRIAKQRVRLTATTLFPGGRSATDLTTGRRVRALGELVSGDADGRILRAEQVLVEGDVEVALDDAVAGPLSAADTSGRRTFVTRIGITVVVRADTILKDDSDQSPDGRLNLQALAVGDFVEVRGFFDANGRLVALTLEREDDDDGCELEARVLGSQLVSGARHYTIAGRPGLVIRDVGSAATEAKVAPGAFGEFEADDPGACLIRPVGQDLNGNPVDAGFLADEIDEESGFDDNDDDNDDDDD